MFTVSYSCAVIVPVVIALMVFYQRLSGSRFHRARALLSDINACLHESLQGMRILRLYGQEARFQGQFTAVTEQIMYRLAKQLPPEYRGVYSDIELLTDRYLVPGDG